MKITTKSIFGSIKIEGEFLSLVDALTKNKADLCDANLRDANLRGADLCDANLRDANLCGANLCDANLRDVGKIEKIKIFTGLYKYIVWSILAKDGSRWVRMGCLCFTLEKWEEIGIRKSNENEFPDNGSEASEERRAAFEFAKQAALRLKK